MEGEQEYTRAMYEVVQELMRQLLINNGNGFDYVPQSSRGIAQYADIDEQLKILSALEEQGVIELRSPRDWKMWSGEADYSTHEVVTTQEKLRNYSAKLSKKLSIEKVPASVSAQEYDCRLRLDVLELKLKIGNYPEFVLIKFQPTSLIYELFVKLSHVPPGTAVDIDDMEHKTNEKDIWQVISKSRLGYLTPFFDKRTAKEIALKPSVRLSSSEIATLVPQNNAKYLEKAEKILGDIASANE